VPSSIDYRHSHRIERAFTGAGEGCVDNGGGLGKGDMHSFSLQDSLI
jgi:hypothetical protein